MSIADRLSPLRAEAARVMQTSLRTLVADDPDRARDFALRVGPIHASFARQRYDRGALEALFALGESLDFDARLEALFAGEHVNVTEARPALHTALRSDLSGAELAASSHAVAREARVAMRAVVEAIVNSGVTDVVSVGIGGSDLGPRLAVDALSSPSSARVRVHFLSNVDGHAAQRVLASLDPSRTAALLVSKSFGTQETLLNGCVLRDWLGDDTRLYGITANIERAAQFGVPVERVLPMWDWVGGRYSMWSSVGLPIALAIGMDGFESMLEGACEMDAHVAREPVRRNLAAWHALTAVWNRNALDLASQAVLPYDDRLRLLPNYLQQLVMESLGKSARMDGSAVGVDTVPVWWGGAGTDTQHSFFQALHQGTTVVPCDFVGVVQPDAPHRDNHDALLSHLLAQSEAFANGQNSDDAHRHYPGGRPSTMFLLDALTPHALGALIALYEHSVFLQSVVWDINAFDQFGVELGKQIANRLLPAVRGEAMADDPVTRALLAEISSMR
ncbi:glucose-6-phosphate isomerase [Cognatilysobacter lacus]|uniref:Glucose-6-phosphate isomerase n=1 Tax=Cognatilysobacter lacus TaxID=1643323 RepID=A0A5D8Z7C1_9GAMM|nr:glucose-6-phosphate isomerase [Lysobacter lacus]TZF90567.1 glucose-6-phosphate isomerase [Lysobacter lacus]